MKCYINGIGAVSPQKTFDNNEFLSEIISYNKGILQCVQPDYKGYINPIAARRMSRVIKMSIFAAKTALQNAGVEMPGAIISGTGLGLMEDTEKFLLSVLNNDEQTLQPTSFIQSTHNTISGQIAIALNCTNYNSTYSHRGASFESALFDALLLLDEGASDNVLVGGFDETSEENFKVSQRLGVWKKEEIHNLELLSHKTKGSIVGEGVAFFVLSKTISVNTYAELSDFEMIYKPETDFEIFDKITSLLSRNNLNFSEIDSLLLGLNGDPQSDEIYFALIEKHFSHSNIAYFKHLSGEYLTSGSFALWLASNIIKRQTIPEVILFKKGNSNAVKNVLVYNHFRNKNHALFLLRKGS